MSRKKNTDPGFVDWFRQSSPYIHAHRGKVFVLSFGGEVLTDDGFANLIHDIALLNGLGIRLVLVPAVVLLAALEPADRFNRFARRLRSMLVVAVGQKRLVGRRRERLSGIMHALIFWGFCVLLIRSITLYGEGFVSDYRRELILDAGLSRTSYTRSGARHVREAFCSRPDGALARGR